MLQNDMRNRERSLKVVGREAAPIKIISSPFQYEPCIHALHEYRGPLNITESLSFVFPKMFSDGSVMAHCHCQMSMFYLMMQIPLARSTRMIVQ